MNVQEELLAKTIDPYLSDAALSRLAREALSVSSLVVGYEVLTGGCWNRVIGIEAAGTPLVCKISPHRRDSKVVREFRVLQVLAEETELPVPEPLFLDEEGRYLPGTTLVMSRIPGAVLHSCVGLLNYGARRNIIRQIADMICDLHARRAHGFGGIELAADDREGRWEDFWLPRFDAVLAEAGQSRAVPAGILKAARALRPRLPAILDVGTKGVMCHYDVWAGNVMVDLDGQEPRVSGFLDPPGFYADYAGELAFARLFGVADRNFMEVYSRRYDIDPGFEVRVAAYNLQMNIKHILMYPGEDFYRRGALSCLQTLQEAL